MKQPFAIVSLLALLAALVGGDSRDVDYDSEEWPEYDLPVQIYKPWDERDYESVKKCIVEEILPLPRDGGTHAPLYIRFGFHVGAMYDKAEKVGGASQAPSRFTKGFFTESPSFTEAWQLLMTCRDRYPWISYSDLWTLSAVAAVEFAGGPKINWRPGRYDLWYQVDLPLKELIVLLSTPPATGDAAWMLWFFVEKWGLTIQDGAALLGAHSMGFAHGQAMGAPYEGVWTDDPFTFSNKYYKYLLEYDWVPDDRYDGTASVPPFTNLPGKEYMMFPVDMIHEVPEFRPYVELYAQDQERFFQDFAAAYKTVSELGVMWEPFAESTEGSPDLAATK